MRCLSLILLGLLLAVSAAAQPVTGEGLLHAWVASQEPRVEQLGAIEAAEEVRVTIDGPRGARTMEAEALVGGRLDAERWGREVTRLQVEGRPVRGERARRIPRWGHPPLGPDAERLLRAALLPLHPLRHLRPTLAPASDQVEGVPVWRLDAMPREKSAPIERATLWFGQEDGRLVRSRVLWRPPHAQGPLVATADYERQDGLDVLRRYRIEGALQTRRRMRVFTLLLSSDATYRDYVFTERDE